MYLYIIYDLISVYSKPFKLFFCLKPLLLINSKTIVNDMFALEILGTNVPRFLLLTKYHLHYLGGSKLISY